MGIFWHFQPYFIANIKRKKLPTNIYFNFSEKLC